MNSSQRPLDPASVPPRRLVGRTQRLPVAAPAEPLVIDPALQALQQQVSDLQAQVAHLSASAAEQERQLEEAERRIDTARESGLAEGFTDGLRRAEADFTARSEALAENAAKALSSFETGVEKLAELSSTIALAALDQVLGSTHGRGDAVARIVGRQLDLLATSAPVEVRVSVEDFVDTAALHDALVKAGVDPACVRADPALAAGQVTVRLQLGEVDAGIDQQLAALRRLLTDRTDAD